jgi:hypothetical protein
VTLVSTLPKVGEKSMGRYLCEEVEDVVDVVSLEATRGRRVGTTSCEGRGLESWSSPMDEVENVNRR